MQDQALRQGSADWHEHRRRHRNASEAPAVLGVCPWLTPRQLAEIKLGLRAPQAENDAMRHGKRTEAAARAWAEAHMGEVFEPQVITRGPYSASLDGLNFEQDTVLEIKCPVRGQDSDAWQAVADGRIPEHYYWQVVHQLYVSRAKRGLLVVFDGAEGIWAEIRPDAADFDTLCDAWDRFMHWVDQGELPPISERDVVHRDDSEWLAAVAAWQDARAQLAEAREREQAARATLVELAEATSTVGGGVRLTRCIRRGAVDYSRIPELQDRDLDPYRRPPETFWRLVNDDPDV